MLFTVSASVGVSHVAAQVASSRNSVRVATNPRNAIETVTSSEWWDSNPRSLQCESNDLAADLHSGRNGETRTPDKRAPKARAIAARRHSGWLFLSVGGLSRLAAFNPYGDAAIETAVRLRWT